LPGTPEHCEAEELAMMERERRRAEEARQEEEWLFGGPVWEQW
jgi:hypothetical protein